MNDESLAGFNKVMIDLKRNSKKEPVKATGLRTRASSSYSPNQKRRFLMKEPAKKVEETSQKDIHLYTAPTMNGWKPVIFLEEAGIEYDLTYVDFSKNEQKDKDYIKNINQWKNPSIIDRSNNDFRVFESGAILWYLLEKYNKFLPRNANEKSITMQWLMFQVGGIGPMMGQAMYFQRIAALNGEKISFHKALCR